MPKSVTVTFGDGSRHVYDNVPDNITPDQVEERASREFQGKQVTDLFAGEEGMEAPPVEEQAPASPAPYARDAVSFAVGREGVPTVQEPSLVNAAEEYGQAISAPSDLDREAGRVAATGVKTGLGALPQLGGDIYASAERGFSGLVERAGVPPIPGAENVPTPSALLRQGLDYLFEPREYERPQTTSGQVAANVLGSGVAALTGPGALTAPGRMIKAGIGAGIGAEVGGPVGEAAGQMVGGDAGAGVGRITGSLLGGMVGGTVPGIRTGNRERVLRQNMPDDVTEAEWMAAQQRMLDAEKQGVHLTVPQALGRETTLDSLQDHLLGRRAGQPLAQQLRNQPDEIQAATEARMGTLPGAVKGQQEIADQAQKEATGAIQQFKDARRQVTEPMYKAVKPLEDADVNALRLQILKEAKKYPGKSDIAAELRDLSRQLYVDKPIIQNGKQTGVKRVFEKDVNKLNLLLREARDSLGKPKLNKPAASATTSKAVGDAITGVKQTIGRIRPDYAKAEDAFAKISEKFVDPVKQGPTGIVAGRTGYDPATPASRTTLYGIFDRGTAKGGRSDIKTLQSDMSKTGPEGRQAFADAGTSWLADKVQAAFQMEGGRVTKDVAANLEKALYGTPNQIRGVNDVLEGIAKSSGTDPQVLKSGFNTWAQTVKLAAKRPSSTKGPVGSEIAREAKTLAGRTAGISVITPFRRIGEKIDDFMTKDAYGYMGRLLQSPEGIDTLKKLSKAKPGSFAADTAIAKFNAIVAAEQNEGE